MGEHTFRNPAELLPGQGFSHIGIPATGRTVYIAGQTAHQRDGSLKGETLAEQADAALANLAAAVRAAGAEPAHLIAMQLYVTDVAAYRESLDEIGTAWRHHLGKHYPTVSLLGVKELFDPEALIEIIATAVIPE